MSDQEQQAEIIEAGSSLAIPGQERPERLYVIPVHNRPFFPAQVLPIVVNEEPWDETLKRVANTSHHCLALFFLDNPGESPDQFDPAQLPEHGTLVRIHHASKEGGKLQFVAQGLSRVRVRGWLSRKPPYLAEVDYPQEIGRAHV